MNGEPFNFEAYLWCVLGIVISVLLPILWEAVNRYFPNKPSRALLTMSASETAIAFWRVVMPYLLLGVTSALTAILVVAAMGDTLKDYRAALLAGYAWDSTLQRLRNK